MYSDTLIDRALHVCGSTAELGRRVGMSRVSAHKLVHRKMKLSPETAALLAAIVNDSPHYAVEQTMIEMAPPALAAKLKIAFRATATAFGAVVMWLISDALTGNPVISHVIRQLTIYTLSAIRADVLAVGGRCARLAAGAIAPAPRERVASASYRLAV